MGNKPPVISAGDLVDGNYTREDFHREIYRRLWNLPHAERDGHAAHEANVIADLIVDFINTDKLDPDTDADEIEAWGELESDLRLIDEAVTEAIESLSRADEIANESLYAAESIRETHYLSEESD